MAARTITLVASQTVTSGGPSGTQDVPRIVDAAVNLGKIYVGRRHYQCRDAAVADGACLPVPIEAQGFMTSDGRFVSREEAAVIAFAAGQTSTDRGYLMSEDVW